MQSAATVACEWEERWSDRGEHGQMVQALDLVGVSSHQKPTSDFQMDGKGLQREGFSFYFWPSWKVVGLGETPFLLDMVSAPSSGTSSNRTVLRL